MKKSVISLIKIAESNYSDKISEGIPETTTYRFVDGVQTEGPELKFTGSMPKNGTIIVQRNGTIQLALDNGITCIVKTFNEDNTITIALADEEVCEISLLLPDTESIKYIYDLPNIGENPTPCLKNELEFTHILDKRDSKTYAVTKIGDQCWFAENLAYTTTECLSAAWTSSEPFDACRLDGGADWNQFEVKYQWGTAMNGSITEGAQGLCPVEWHIPTDDEWKTLEMLLGMTQIQADASGSFRGTNQGAQLKNTSPSWDGTNTVGFMGLPAALRHESGSGNDPGTAGHWWTSSPSGLNAWKRFFNSSISGVYRAEQAQGFGNSVRCLLNQ